jgi:hypothetical protein
MAVPLSSIFIQLRPALEGSVTLAAVFTGSVVFSTNVPSVPSNAHASAMSPCVVGRFARTELMRAWSVTTLSYGAMVVCAYAPP